jgi:hypothetical protein
MSGSYESPKDGETLDLFTRLSIAMCAQDDGTRPVNPAWTGSDISFLSPAIQFASFPVPAGQPTQVKILIDNFGTADASSVTLETAYNVYISNQAATMVGIQNQTIPLIPAGCTYPAVVTWTPPDVFIAHACFYARVFDTYSLLHHAARCFSWDPYVNPQTGSHNTILLKIVDPTQAVVVTYPVINSSAIAIQPKLLVTVLDDRARFNDLDERFPLPFVPDHLTSTGVLRATASPAADLYTAGLSAASRRVATRVRHGESGRLGRVGAVSASRRWPQEDVSSRFVHHRFGIDAGERLELPGDQPRMRREVFFTAQPLADVQLDSFSRLQLAPGEEKLVRLVIPPSEFPPPGRRKKFQVDYQAGDERPVQNFVYLYS